MSPPAPPPSLISDLRSLPRAFWVLFCGTFINRFGTFVWPFLTSAYLTRQGYTLSDAAWAISAVGGRRARGQHGRRLAGRSHPDGATPSCSELSARPATRSAPLRSAHAAGDHRLRRVNSGWLSGTYHPAASALLADIVPKYSACVPTRPFAWRPNGSYSKGASVGRFCSRRYSTSQLCLYA
jgi:hypothetical protein